MKLTKFETSQPILIFSQKRKKQKQVTDHNRRTITTTLEDNSWQMALAIPDLKAIGRDIRTTVKAGLKSISDALINTFIPQPLYAG